MIEAIDHIQLAIPPGGEEAARPFYTALLGFTEIEKPDALKASGGAWFVNGRVHLHFGVQEPFIPATKAHPAFLVKSLDALKEKLAQHHIPIKTDPRTPNIPRFFINDPFGNRLEFIQAGNGFSERMKDEG